MTWMRPTLAVVAGLGFALICYGIAFSHGDPHGGHPDPALAAHLIPLELLLGLLAGWWIYRVFGRRQAVPPRPDTQERMVARLALRRGGRFTLPELEAASPLTREQAREVVARMAAAGRLTVQGEEYRLP